MILEYLHYLHLGLSENRIPHSIHWLIRVYHQLPDDIFDYFDCHDLGVSYPIVRQIQMTYLVGLKTSHQFP
jgi:hypothetical protein